jgi:flagellar assembly protein FliH
MGHESPVRPYAFERIFALSAVDAERNPQDQALQLLALQAELDRLHIDHASELVRAREDGFAAGLAQARTDTAAALVAAETALVAGIDQLECSFTETEARMARLAADVARAAADLLAARAIGDDPNLAIDAAIARVLSQTNFRETLHVHVHPSIVAPLRDLVGARQTAEQRPLDITIHDDVTIPVGDAHIVWDQGGLSLDAEARTVAVREALGIAST